VIVYAAIDLRAGHVVRLDQGDFSRETRYAPDPVAIARGYAASGASWVHVVDLDAARLGRFMHHEVVARIANETELSIQVGGGVRNEADVEGLLELGASRIVVGSVAVRQPDLVAAWLKHFGLDRIVIALDTRVTDDGRWLLPIKGWTEDSGIGLFDLLERYDDTTTLRHVVCTDIARDGMLSGPNVDLYRILAARYPLLAIQASGGVRDVDDVRALKAVGVGGAIVGKALLEGRVTVRELAAC
jgi:phosphoribosylformimino-5-aminoimidazole carboxamide ribotide isomerase